MTKSQRALGLLIWVGWALRVVGLGQQELRGDEAFGYFLARQGYTAIVSETLRLHEPHPVGSYFLAHAWMGVVGDSETALRFPSAWFALLAVPLVWALARRLLHSDAPALVAAVLLALSSYQVWHAQDARMYGESATLGLLAAWLLWQAARHRRLRWWLAFALAVAVALHVHYYNAFLMAVLDLTALALAWKQRLVTRWLAAQAVIAALWGPWLLRVWGTLTTYGGNGDSPGPGEALRRVATTFSVGETAPEGWQVAGAVVWLALMVAGVWGLHRRQRLAAALLTLYLVVPVAAIWIASWQRPIFNERYLLLASPAAAILLGAAWDAARVGWQRRVAGGLIAFLLLANLVSLVAARTDPAHSKTIGWRRLAGALADAAPTDHIVQNFPDPTLWYYYRGPTPHTVLPPQPNDREGTQAVLAALGAEPRRLWFIPQRAPGWDADGLVEATLTRHFDLRAEARLGVFRLLVFDTPARSRAAWMPVGAEFGGVLRLEGYRLDVAMVEPGGSLRLTLFWRRVAPSPIAYTAFVHLIGPDEQMAGQSDGPLGGAAIPVAAWQPDVLVVDKRALSVHADAAPGAYHLAVGLYDPATVARAPVQAAGWRTDADRLFLQEVTLTAPSQ